MNIFVVSVLYYFLIVTVKIINAGREQISGQAGAWSRLRKASKARNSLRQTISVSLSETDFQQRPALLHYIDTS